MSETFERSNLESCEAISRSTYSPGSADGRSRSVSQDGHQSAASGQQARRASPSQALLAAVRPVQMTLETYGRRQQGSTLQQALQRSLESRLPVEKAGLPARGMTWRKWAVISGQQFYRLAVSVATMRALGFTLLATPTATANQGAKSMQKWEGCRGVEVSPEAWCRRMGYPAEWLSSAPLETPSSLASRRRSSPARTKRFAK